MSNIMESFSLELSLLLLMKTKKCEELKDLTAAELQDLLPGFGGCLPIFIAVLNYKLDTFMPLISRTLNGQQVYTLRSSNTDAYIKLIQF